MVLNSAPNQNNQNRPNSKPLATSRLKKCAAYLPDRGLQQTPSALHRQPADDLSAASESPAAGAAPLRLSLPARMIQRRFGFQSSIADLIARLAFDGGRVA
jgi:hypothetical protein